VKNIIPQEIINILEKLQASGYDAYVVGGCVRDYLLSKEPKDWDVTTSAKPEEIQEIFPESFYENSFGTVTILTKNDSPALKAIEITPFRIEGKYSDRRHPDDIKFAKTLKEDLSRRDFTINALAMGQNKVIDLFNGREDLEKKLIRAVGSSNERFREDALRMMRAVRFATELDFEIETETAKAIKNNADLIREISVERIRDELVKILSIPSRNPAKNLKFWEESRLEKEDLESGAVRGLDLLYDLGLLKHILPELEVGKGVTQNKHHIFTVWEHNIKAFAYAVKMNFSLDVKIASLFHDIAKPQAKRGEGPDSTFYGHEVVGAKITSRILNRLKFPKESRDKIVKLVRWHLFLSDPDKITLSAVKRVVRNVGRENIWELINVRKADRIGSGVPKAEPFRLRTYKALIDQALREPISLKMVKINGGDIMRILEIPPGPKVGLILKSIMGEVLDDASRNNKKYLERRITELNGLSEKELKELSKSGEEKWEEVEEEEIREIKKKHYVN
jgi:tRNA nucleotidyltransferase (CCA-adding enzyme)